MGDETYQWDMRCRGRVKAPQLTDEQREKGWDRCYRITKDPSGYCYQHRAQQDD